MLHRRVPVDLDGTLNGYTRWVPFATLAFAQTILTQAHILLVFFRSHLNPVIFRRHRLRFTLVPIAVFAATLWSNTFFLALACFAFYFDLYHSSMQTFGLGRIYDVRAGLAPQRGRGWDIWLNHFLYIGPLIAGINFVPFLHAFARAGRLFPSLKPIIETLHAYREPIGYTVLAASVLFLLCYVVRCWMWKRQGHAFAPLKLLLLAVTSLVTIYSWAFLPFPLALLIVNFYHAVQYIGIIWWSERQNLAGLLHVKNPRTMPMATLCALLLPAFLYGLLWIPAQDYRHWAALTLVSSVLHYWYDGFIWSVRRRQIPTGPLQAGSS